MEKQLNREEKNSRRFVFQVSYDGTAYRGWQFQPDADTVQGRIESSILEITGSESRINGAGRTDAGVHAVGQVAHFNSETRLELHVLERALNARLPADIRIRNMQFAPDPDFHSRFSARVRHYRYRIYDPASREAVLKARTHWLRKTDQLDIAKLNSISATLIGEHNFYSFSRGEDINGNHLCTVYGAEWSKEQEISAEFNISANRFLRGMIRMLVGALLSVAEDKTTLEEFRQALDKPGRLTAAVPAPAHGLTLLKVEYPDFNLDGF